jgi:hypothetical protein
LNTQACRKLTIDCAVGPDRVAELAERNRYLILVRGADFLPIFEKPQKGRSNHAVPQSA